MTKIDLSNYTPKREEISIPEWSAEPLFIQELQGKQLEMLQRYTVVVKGKGVVKHQYALLVIASVVDAEGNFMFDEKDIEALEKQPAKLIAKVIEVVNRVSGIEVASL